MKPRFKNNESYMHKLGKEIFMDWINNKPSLLNIGIIKTKIEEPQTTLGHYLFVPDITIYSKEGIHLFIEVVHTHPVSWDKMHNIYQYVKEYRWFGVELREISAEWIMKQTGVPKELQWMSTTKFN